jgi:pimeloyl-ACP methyl ester carboxylesterase
MVRDLVVLVPGFLGFSRIGGFYYFADRVIGAMRGLLQSRARDPVAVVACPMPPTDGLADRQRALCAALDELCRRPELARVERLHLVGHSAGGVDAQLLACRDPLGFPSWAAHPHAGFRGRLRSVVTVAAPHHGTGLADTVLAAFADHPLHQAKVALHELAVVRHLFAVMRRDLGVLAGAGSGPLDVLRFLWQVARNRDLIRDLRPDAMARLRREARPEPGVTVTCFATGTPHRAEGTRTTDPFFGDLLRLVGEGFRDPGGPELGASVALLRHLVARHPALVIRSPRAALPADVDLTLSDGVVNTASQVLVGPSFRFGGLVVADHGDVLGHYDRVDPVDGRAVNEGLFHSGAAFGDDEFFALYGRVASAVGRAMRSAAGRYRSSPAARSAP